MRRSRPTGWRRHSEAIHAWLERLYLRYHDASFIGTDPLLFLHRYARPEDQEIVGLIASSLAYGHVTMINRNVDQVLRVMHPSPRAFLEQARSEAIHIAFRDFRHRWTDGSSISSLLLGIRDAIHRHGSLGRAFLAVDAPHVPIQITLSKWVALLHVEKIGVARPLLADPAGGSACKRLHLFLRWMIRRDVIDPGCWRDMIAPSRLMIPLDTHMFRLARKVGFTRRLQPDGQAVADITDAFRTWCPDDPVKYDFALTRPGIVHGWTPTGKQPWLTEPPG